MQLRSFSPFCRLSFLLLLLFSASLCPAQSSTPVAEQYATARNLWLERDFPAALAAANTADSLAALLPVSAALQGDILWLQGIQHYNLQDYYPAIERLTSADSIFAHLGLHGRRADAQLFLGNAFWYLNGDTESALAYFERAVELAEAAPQDRQEYCGRYYADKSLAYMYLSEFEKAKLLALDAVRRDSLHFGWYHRNTAASLLNLANYYRFQEDNPGALATFEQVEQIYDTILINRSKADLGPFYGDVAKAYLNQLQFARAEDYYLRALGIFQAMQLPPSSYNVLLVHVSLGEVYYNLGDRERMHQYYEFARTNNRNEYPSIMVSAAQGTVFELELDQQYQRANDTLHRLLPLFQQSYGVASLNWAQLNERLARNHLALAQNDSARWYLRRSEATYRQIASERSPALARIQALTARSFLRENQLDSALHYAQAGIDLLWEPHHDFAQIAAPDVWSLLLDLQGIATQYNTSGDTIVNQHRALEIYLRADDYFDFLRRNQGHTEDKNALESIIDDTHEKAITLCRQLAATDPSYRELAFQLAEKNKAYLLLETVKRSRLPALEAFLQEQRDIQARINYYRRQLLAADPTGTSTEPRLVGFRSSIARLNQAAIAREASARTANPRLFASLDTKGYLSVAEVQSRLGPEEGLLEYFTGERRCFAFLITRDDYQFIELTRANLVDSLVQAFRAHIEQPEGYTLDYLAPTAHTLYQILLAPLADRLPRRLTIVPDGVLNYVPFEALLTAPATNVYQPAQYPYLLRQHQITYNYSATLLAEMSAPQITRSTNDKILGLAPFAPITDLATAERYGGQRTTAGVRPWKPLPGSRRNLEALIDTYGATGYFADQATLARFLESAPQYRILHLATHGQAEVGDGIEPFIVFAGSSPGTRYDSLYVRDLYTLALPADLVVLSACQTALGELRRGEGLISLARGFAYAGARSLVTTLWSVDDASTEAILRDFYRHYFSGMPQDAALRRAKLDYLEQHAGTEAHPGFWAGIVGIGFPE